MNTQKRNYAWLWPYIWTILWMLRMLCAGTVIGYISIWLGTKTPLGKWNIALGTVLTAVIYVLFARAIDWLAFGCKILLSRLAGFRFVGLWFRWLFVKRKNGILRFQKAKHYNKYGTCHMLPPKKEGEQYSMLLYYFGGGIGLTVLGIAGLVIFYLSPEKATVWMAALLMFSVLALLGPIDFLLQKVTTDWDSLQLWFQPWMKKAFRLMNQISYSRSMGIWLQDMPEEWFVWEPEYVIENYYVEWLACYRFQYLFYSEQYQQAEQFAEEVLEPNMKANRVKKCLASRMLYIKMLLYNEETVKEFYEKAKEILLETTDSENYRSLYLYLKYIAKLPETAEKYYVLWEKALVGQEERDIAMEREQVRRIAEKWGDMR